MLTAPKEMYVIKVQGQWPIHAYENEVHALTAYKRLAKENEPNRVKVWLMRTTLAEELEYEPPGRPTFVPAVRDDSL